MAASARDKSFTPRSNLNTVFVRGLPSTVTRAELTTLFGDIGPVKKASVIRSKDDNSKNVGKGFGFVKFSTEADAKEAAKKMDGVEVERGGSKYFLNVAIASDEVGKKEKNKREKSKGEKGDKNGGNTVSLMSADSTVISSDKSPQERAREAAEFEILAKKKRSSKVIIRNLSFYAKESHIRSVMSAFGEIAEINLPMVTVSPNSGEAVGKPSPKTQHRGFAFVTFASVGGANKAIAASGVEGGLKSRDGR